MTYVIEPASPVHCDGWARLRIALWPDEDAQHLTREASRMAHEPSAAILNLLALHNGEVIGFAEASVRTDYVNSCVTSPVVFLEGIYVAPAHRKRGVARALVMRVQQWGKDLGLSEFASDALLDNADSHAMHKALGFEETDRVVYFRKSL